jgi:hypothetical protein
MAAADAAKCPQREVAEVFGKLSSLGVFNSLCQQRGSEGVENETTWPK